MSPFSIRSYRKHPYDCNFVTGDTQAATNLSSEEKSMKAKSARRTDAWTYIGNVCPCRFWSFPCVSTHFVWKRLFKEASFCGKDWQAGVPRSTHPCCHAHLTWRKGVGLDSSCVCPSNLLTVSQTIRCKRQPVMWFAYLIYFVCCTRVHVMTDRSPHWITQRFLIALKLILSIFAFLKA